ncbi:phospholipase D-like domain-containing protein [Streptomyces sp. NBC_00572]|uniref:phospholipase D-like domain-containing protein n=1 Tax=Streptomyces sp. NBC_00572 TaxID=2903664 RepID=UPI00225B4335|nr:phospholipase D-like domain-containing protein [Streptomyces sp. NBC_00572]MCX4980592.1 phospholipase D-like domain-containing protein [Streptomyces sp. NBC_00572]
MISIKSKFRTAATALAVGATLVVAPSASAEPVLAVTTGAVFNDPNSTDASARGRILSHLAGLVDGAEAGSTIRISLYLFHSVYLANKLGDAHKRGVSVQVVVDDDSRSTGLDTLKTRLADPAGSPGSWVRGCKAEEACLALDPGTTAADPNGTYDNVNHNKFFLFSRTKGKGTVLVDNVVVQSSANLTSNDTDDWWNDALTVADNAELFGAYTGYFDDQAAAAIGQTPQVADYAHDTQAGKAKVYFFPRSSTDTVVNILGTVAPVGTPDSCAGNSPGFGTADGRTKIRIAQGHITRTEVARKLWELANAGCDIEVVYRSLDNWTAGDQPMGQVANWLTRPVTGKGRITLHQLDNDKRGGSDSHTKYLLVEGTYYGGVDKKIVFTGSHTYTTTALKYNDEALLKYEDATVFDAYVGNFEAQRAAALAGL